MDPAGELHREPPATPEFLTARAAAAQMGIAERTIRRAIARGDLRAVKRAGAFEISPADLERYRRGRSRRRDAANDDRGAARGPAAPKPGELPVPLTSLVGREREIAALATALRGPDRLLTLTGAGGVGKTRPAIAAASAAADDPGTICYVALGAVSDHHLVAPAIAHALDVQEAGGVRLGLSVDGNSPDVWGAYRLDHTYDMEVAGTGRPLALEMQDSVYTDNSRLLNFEILCG